MSIFTQVESTRLDSNTFDLSHDKKMSCDMGKLVPSLILEVVPGDKFNIQSSQMLRFAPMVAPVMHRVQVYQHYFFVPNRIMWDGWEDFITGGPNGLDIQVPPFFNLRQADTAQGTLADYLGVPDHQNGTQNLKVSAFPFNAYTKIYDEYYRDQNLQPDTYRKLTDGQNIYNANDVAIKLRAWQHDYFTSALPFTQKGNQATIPLGISADIKLKPASGAGQTLRDVNTGTLAGGMGLQSGTVGQIQGATTGNPRFNVDPAGTLYADLSTASASTINDLRKAFKLQEWLEKNARAGSRYIESILSHFGVRSSDKRLQRPEYLGGSATPVVISEVLQTAPDSSFGLTPVGNMAGHGISVGGGNNINFVAEEHGYIIGIMSIMPQTAYQQGLPKHFSKFDKFDYFWPSFAHLGEQPIISKEVYADGTPDDETIFGYTPRYAEYKFQNDTVHGDFKGNLDFWHMGRKFANRPLLNNAFIECDPTQRIFAVTDPTIDKLWVHIINNVKATRKMPIFGTPKIT